MYIVALNEAWVLFNKHDPAMNQLRGGFLLITN